MQASQERDQRRADHACAGGDRLPAAHRANLRSSLTIKLAQMQGSA
jgi:hypothetical protein